MAEEDIFMDYSTTSGCSSPIDCEPQNEIKMKFSRLGDSLESIVFERNCVISQLKTENSSIETHLKLLQLRKFNRHVSNIITEHRKRLSDLKDLVDNLNSKLLCQKFEKKHLLDEIKSCLSSKYTRKFVLGFTIHTKWSLGTFLRLYNWNLQKLTQLPPPHRINTI
jgi:hypothetical protein